MSIQTETINAFEKTIFERAVIKAPLRFTSSLFAEDRACFFYLRRGEYQVASEANQVNVRPREGLLKKCGNYIAQFFRTDEEDECEAIVAFFYPEILKEIYSDTIPRFLKNRPAAKPLQKVASNELLDRYIQSLLVYFENPDLADEELVVLKLKELILLLLKTDQADSVLELVSDFFNPRVFALKEVVENHAFNDVSVEELAFLCHLSLSSFKREFTKIYADTPAQYIRNRKLARAAELLEFSDTRVTEICYDCGFNDLANFSTAFHKKYGRSPKQYRLDLTKKSAN